MSRGTGAAARHRRLSAAAYVALAAAAGWASVWAMLALVDRWLAGSFVAAAILFLVAARTAPPHAAAPADAPASDPVPTAGAPGAAPAATLREVA